MYYGIKLGIYELIWLICLIKMAYSSTSEMVRVELSILDHETNT